jgi:hypothetical protein
MYNRVPSRRPKQIFYAGVFFAESLKAQFSKPGTIPDVVEKLVCEGVRPNARSSFNYENTYHVHLLNVDGKSFVVVVESGYSKKLAFEMIEVMKDLRYPSSEDLEEITKRFIANQNEDRITRINSEVNEINDIVMTNIQRVLKNTAKMEVIAQKTEEMETRALIFKKGGDELFSLARCQNIKWTIICGLSGLILIGVLGVTFFFAVN